MERFSIPEFISCDGKWLSDALVRGRVSRTPLGRRCLGTESFEKPYAPSDNQKKL